jgi:hypothetical protein
VRLVAPLRARTRASGMALPLASRTVPSRLLLQFWATSGVPAIVHSRAKTSAFACERDTSPNTVIPSGAMNLALSCRARFLRGPMEYFGPPRNDIREEILPAPSEDGFLPGNKSGAPFRGVGRRAEMDLTEWTKAFAGTRPLARRISAATFYHPDYTVGPGVSPDRGKDSDK